MSRRSAVLIGSGVLAILLGPAGRAVNPPPAPLAIDSESASVGLSLKTGADPSRVTWAFKDGAPLVLTFKAAGSKLTIEMRASRKEPSNKQTFPLDDQYIALSGFPSAETLACYVRPNLARYVKDRQLEYIKKWADLPPASGHWLEVECRLDPAGFELWLDGRYGGRHDGPRPVSVTVQPGKGGEFKELACRKSGADEHYLPLDVASIGSATWRDVSLPYQEGAGTVEGVPMMVRGARAGDVGAVRFEKATAEECDFYLARSPLDGMPETFHFSVPANQYAYAHILCAADSEPGKVPELTARITRYVRLRGVSCDAIMDTGITLPRPGEKVPANVKALGEVSYKKDEREIKTPLYLVRLPLKTGAISDLVFQPHDSPLMGKTPYLDFEIVGPVLRPRYASHALYPDNNVTSSVQVLGLTLERSPMALELKQEQPGNVFYNNEPPALAGELRGLEPSAGALEWTVSDYDGAVVESGSKPFRLEPGAKESFRIPLDKLAPGWYAAELRVREGEKEWVKIPVTAAILGQDTRRATAESPYASRTASIMQPPDPETHGILMQKAGIRGITPMSAALDAGEKVYAQWKVRGWQIPWIRSGMTNDAEAEAEIEKKIREYLEKYPSAKKALIFHESVGGPFPPELLDQPAPDPDPQTAERDQNLFKAAARTCKVYRDKFPNIRLQAGNAGNSLYPVALLMRQKFPKEYIDALGEESLGQAKMPENPHFEYGNGTALNFWNLKQLALKMGYGDLPVEPCSEWKGRMSTDLGDRTKAEWDMRDLLISYAFGCGAIRTGDITDQGSMFYNNEYGSQGLLRRYPLMYPKPSYVATAALTKVLDGVKLVRQVPMESETAYVLEFKRYGKEYVYAVWLPRGAAELSFDFGRDARILQVSMLGKETALKTKDGKLAVTASTGPCYLIGPDAVKSVSRVKEIPDVLPEGVFVASAMDKAADWRVLPQDPNLNVKRSAAHGDGIKGGEFELSEVKDAEQGPCLKWELKTVDADPAERAGLIRLKEPAAVPGQPNTIGVMVKGNSSWARLDFEFEDAEGEIWRSAGADWPANLSVNFDGWHWVRFPIDATAAWPHYIYPNWIKHYWTQGPRVLASGGEPNPDAADDYWTRPVKTGNKTIDYPIKLLGINVLMPRKVLNLTEMKDVKNLSLCFKDFGAYHDAAPENKK